MSNQTKIEWTDATWNPVRGCTKVSAGCKNCYAERFSERWRGIPGHPFEHGFDLRLVPEKLSEPLRWRKPRRVFVNSMSDLFHEQIPNEYIAAVFGVMAATPQHTYQVLTKRPQRMIDWFGWIERNDSACNDCACEADAHKAWSWPEELPDWPLPNVWLGVSVENQQTADQRIPLLLNTPAAVRFLSCEPLLGPVDLEASAPGPKIDWVIVGGESGPGARDMDPDWARSVRDQCEAAGVPFFMKQMARKLPIPNDLNARQWPE